MRGRHTKGNHKPQALVQTIFGHQGICPMCLAVANLCSLLVVYDEKKNLNSYSDLSDFLPFLRHFVP